MKIYQTEPREAMNLNKLGFKKDAPITWAEFEQTWRGRYLRRALLANAAVTVIPAVEIYTDGLQMHEQGDDGNLKVNWTRLIELFAQPAWVFSLSVWGYFHIKRRIPR